MQDLKVSLIQTELAWEDKSINIQRLDKQLSEVSADSHLILLPEMFNTGFSMEAEKLAESMEGETVAWMKDKANRLNAVVCGSLIIEENGKYFNRLIWMRPDASFATYDKKHLFRLTGEEKIFTAGSERLIVELHGWKICPQICYDLRFPVWNRNRSDYDILIFVANWPEKRSLAWRQLLIARAIENEAYVIGLNRVGVDGNNFRYSGDSMVNNFDGETVFSSTNESIIYQHTFSYSALQEFKERFPFYKDADDFQL